MPYINKNLRNTPDLIVDTVKNDGIVEALVILNDYVDTLPIDQVDGVMSYIFMKLLRNVYLDHTIAGVDMFINGAIQGVYLEKKNYFKLNRLMGLLYCLRTWCNHLEWKVVGYIDKLLEIYSKSYFIPYEEKKRMENGDI